MKITVKTVQGKSEEYEVNEENTIGDLKTMIHEKMNIPQETITIIYKSKMMKDDTEALSKVGIVDGDNVVIVIKKSAAKPAAAQPPKEPVKEQVKEPSPVGTEPVQQQQQQQTELQTQPVDIFQNTQQQNKPEPTEDQILQIIDMGFTRENAIKALKKAQNNVQAAVNLLLSGINLDSIPDQDYDQQQQQTSSGSDELDQLLSMPKDQFITFFEAHKDMFEPMLQRVDPPTAQLIRNNPGMLYDLLKNSSQAQYQTPQQSQYQSQPQYQAPQAPAANHGPQLTQEDNEAIQRLTDLGYSKEQCVQAYIACDKNEILAANFLLDGGMQ